MRKGWWLRLRHLVQWRWKSERGWLRRAERKESDEWGAARDVIFSSPNPNWILSPDNRNLILMMTMINRDSMIPPEQGDDCPTHLFSSLFSLLLSLCLLRLGTTHDLLYDFGRRVQVDETLVDSHFETIPSLWTFTTWRFTDSVGQDLCWETDWSFDTKLLVLWTRDEVGTDWMKIE